MKMPSHLHLGYTSTELAQSPYAAFYRDEMAPLPGIQLADENLARRPAKFVSDANMVRLDQARAKYDPQGRFHPWMGRIS